MIKDKCLEQTPLSNGNISSLSAHHDRTSSPAQPEIVSRVCTGPSQSQLRPCGTQIATGAGPTRESWQPP